MVIKSSVKILRKFVNAKLFTHHLLDRLEEGCWKPIFDNITFTGFNNRRK